MPRKSLKVNVVLNFAYQLLKIALPLVTTPYLARIIGSESVGIYGYTYSIANYFVMFATMGMSSYGVRQISSCGDDEDKRSVTFWNAYCSQLMIGLLVLAAYFVYCGVFADEYSFLSFIWSLWVLSALVDCSWLLFGTEDFLVTTIRSSIVKLISLVAIFIFVKSSADLWIYVLIIAASYLLEQLLVWPFVPRCVHFVRPETRLVRGHFGPNFRLFIPVIAISLYSSLDKVLLGVMSNMNEVGYYEYAYKICTVPLALVTGLGTVMLPRLSDIFSNGRAEDGIGLIAKTFHVMQFGALGMAFGIVAVAQEFVPVFFGEGYASCEPCMCILALSLPFIAGSNVIGRQFLLPTFKDNQYTISVFIGAGVNIAVVLLLIPQLGALGAAIGTMSGEFAVFVSQALFARGCLHLGLMLRRLVPFVLVGFAMFFLVRFIAYLGEQWAINSLVLLIAEVAVGAVFYCLVCYPKLGMRMPRLKRA